MAKRFFPYLIVFAAFVGGGVFAFHHNAGAYQFNPQNAAGYCVAPISGINTSDTRDVLSFIEYGQSYGALPQNEQTIIDNLLIAPTPRYSSGLVPCGRQCDDPTTAVNEAIPCNFCHIFVLFHNIVNTLLEWALLLVILFVAAGGFLIMVSGGSSGGGKKVDIAGVGSLLTGGGVSGVKFGRGMITSALVGYAIMLSAWVIVNVFFSLIGVAQWVNIGQWWKPNCPVPGYIYTPNVDANGNPLDTGTWTYHS